MPVRRAALEPFNAVLKMLGGKIRAQHGEAVSHVQARRAFGVFAHDLDGFMAHLAHLAHHHDVVILVGQRPQPFQKAQILGPCLVVDIVLHPVEVGRHDLWPRLRGRVGAQFLVVKIVVHRIQPEPVEPPVEPEFAGLQDSVDHIGIVEIEIGLRGQKVVQVILPPAGIKLPCRAAEMAVPIGGRRSVRQRIGPDIPIGFVIVAALPGLLEPVVLIRRVRQHLIHDDLQPLVMGGLDQAIKRRHIPKKRVDSQIVRDVIAHISLRRGKDRRQPDAIDAKRGHMVQPAGDPVKIAHAITGAVLIGPRINLIDYGATPPFLHEHSHFVMAERVPACRVTMTGFGLNRQSCRTFRCRPLRGQAHSAPARVRPGAASTGPRRIEARRSWPGAARPGGFPSGPAHRAHQPAKPRLRWCR